jgi:hypothetical protein
MDTPGAKGDRYGEGAGCRATGFAGRAGARAEGCWVMFYNGNEGAGLLAQRIDTCERDL